MDGTADLKTRPDPEGLTTRQAQALLSSGGGNSIADVAQHPVRRALGKLWAPVPWMLEAAILLQIGLGDDIEAGVVAFLLLANAALGFIQEGRAQATLDALKSRLALLAIARRDREWKTVPATTLVIGDLVKISVGSIVPADVRLSSGSLLIDRSMLTGESRPVDIEAGDEANAGASVKRGEATALVTATGSRTKFGRTAELVRDAHAVSSQQTAIFRVVRNLAVLNGVVTMLLAIYAMLLEMPLTAIVPLVLVALLSSIPVALPSMFTLAAAVGARALARQGVLPTRLSAVDEAGGIDVLCADKTGTLTRNALAVVAVHALAGFDEAHVLAFAALASSDGGQDPVDGAIRAAARKTPVSDAPQLVDFLPFDPATKRAEATVRVAAGATGRIVKGAYAELAKLCAVPAGTDGIVIHLQAQGLRVIAVASGDPAKPALVGLVALSDPPREDSAALVSELRDLGVRMIMVTGDARVTAEFVANAIGLEGAVNDRSPLPDRASAEAFGVYAGVLPEDKFKLVAALQKSGHIVGMCGDGANDAPALRQAQMGIAVSTATDVAKSSAGLVLTQPGLGGVVAAVKEGRTTYQRILTYTLRTIVHKVVQVLFLAIGLVITGQAILTPMLMVLMMVTGDFLAMSSSTDRVRPSATPSIWRIGNLTKAGIVMGLVDLAFCVGCLSVGRFVLKLDPLALQTLTVVTLVYSGQSLFYVAREREHIWSSLPGRWVIASSVIDLSLITLLAFFGLLMAPLPGLVLLGLLGGAFVFAFVLDSVKLAVFRRLKVF